MSRIQPSLRCIVVVRIGRIDHAADHETSEPFHVLGLPVVFTWGDSGLKNAGALPSEVGQVVRADPAQAQRWMAGEAEQEPVHGGERSRGMKQTLVVEGDQAGVEEVPLVK